MVRISLQIVINLNVFLFRKSKRGYFNVHASIDAIFEDSYKVCYTLTRTIFKPFPKGSNLIF